MIERIVTNLISNTIKYTLIEDDLALRTYVEQRLSECYNMYTASNGVQGIMKVKKIYPQILITDLMMSVADKFDVCYTLRSNIQTSHIPIIVLSALGQNTENKIKALESGANVFIDKPFDMDYLLKQIDNLIKNPNNLKELYSKKYIAEPSKITISSMDEELLKKAIDCIEKNISNGDYNVDSFVSDMGIGRTLLYQKISDIVGMSIKEFIMDIRLKRGAQLYTLANYPYLNLGPEGYQFNSGDAGHNAYRSFFGRVMYSWADRYMIQANLRSDGSSRFAKGHRWGTFLTVSTGWIISEESWFNKKVVDYLKLRGSIGQLGNERIGSEFLEQGYDPGLSIRGLRSPYPDDPVFQAKYEAFLVAFAEQCNRPEMVEFIDGYGLGKWGEGHTMI